MYWRFWPGSWLVLPFTSSAPAEEDRWKPSPLSSVRRWLGGGAISLLSIIPDSREKRKSEIRAPAVARGGETWGSWLSESGLPWTGRNLVQFATPHVQKVKLPGLILAK